MSIHRSLFIGGALERPRSVFTRRERLEALEKEGRWSEESSVFGIPKVRTQFKTLSRKQKKAAEAAASEAAASETEGEESSDES